MMGHDFCGDMEPTMQLIAGAVAWHDVTRERYIKWINKFLTLEKTTDVLIFRPGQFEKKTLHFFSWQTKMGSSCEFQTETPRARPVTLRSKPETSAASLALARHMATVWRFPQMGILRNGWFTLDNPIKMDDLGYPNLSKPPFWLTQTYHTYTRAGLMTKWYILGSKQIHPALCMYVPFR